MVITIADYSRSVGNLYNWGHCIFIVLYEMRHPLLKPLLISPPFGNHLKFKWATSVSGSYTILHRPGLIVQALKTIRKTKAGWVNRMGLRNPGLLSQPRKWDKEKILSFVALRPEDWDIFLYMMPPEHMVEINLECPNINEHVFALPSVFTSFVNRYKLVSVKLPGVFERALEYFDLAYTNNVRVFHICNTIPVPEGGLSGHKVKELSMRLINAVRTQYKNDFTIIAGGGIYSPRAVHDYKNVGADHFSLSTVWFTPWKVLGIKGIAAL